MLKAAVEVHIFFLVTIALVIKCLNGENAADEVLSKNVYDIILIGSWIVGVLLGFV